MPFPPLPPFARRAAPGRCGARRLDDAGGSDAHSFVAAFTDLLRSQKEPSVKSLVDGMRFLHAADVDGVRRALAPWSPNLPGQVAGVAEVLRSTTASVLSRRGVTKALALEGKGHQSGAVGSPAWFDSTGAPGDAILAKANGTLAVVRRLVGARKESEALALHLRNNLRDTYGWDLRGASQKR